MAELRMEIGKPNFTQAEISGVFRRHQRGPWSVKTLICSVDTAPLSTILRPADHGIKVDTKRLYQRQFVGHESEGSVEVMLGD